MASEVRGRPHTERLLFQISMLLCPISSFLSLLSRDARTCRPIKILIAAAEAGGASWIHQRPKDLLLALAILGVFGPREWLE